jgi:nucleotide-binding universal stress UspA family protein
MVVLFIVAAAWVAFGAGAAAVMHRRGHDMFPWALAFLALGPLALPLAVSAERHHPPLPECPDHDGGLDVLVGQDGSADAAAALEAALTFLGPQMTSLTLAAVVDLEAPGTVRGRDTLREAHERLDALAGGLSGRTAAPVETVVLYGEPGAVLQQYAAEHGYEVIVMGNSSATSSHLVRRRAAHTSVPFLIGPATR